MSMEHKEYPLEELLIYEQPTAYIVNSTDYSDEFSIPVLTAGKSFILGYTNEDDGVFDELPVIIFDDFTTASQYVDFKFKVKSSAMKILHVNTELVLPKYIYYRLQVVQFDHSTHKRYWIQHYSKIRIKIPPLDEQKLIVARIEEKFSELENGMDSLKRAEERIELYKYAAIDNAIKYENLSNIKENILNMGQGWSPKCEKRNSIDDNEWAVIKTTAVQAGDFLYQENKVLPSNLEPRSQHEIEVGDILITRAGPKSRCGVCCLVKKTKRKLINCDKVYRIKVDENKILPQFLEYVLNSPRFLKEIAMCKTGGNDSGLNLTQERFLDIKIPVPSIETQKQIIAEIEARISICDEIRKTVSEALIQSEALRLCILKESFEGRI